jgi:hypothetical protein
MKARLKGFTDESTGEVQNVRLREISEESIKDRDVDGAIGSIEEALRTYIAKLEPSAHSQVLEVKSYLNGEKPEVEPLTLDGRGDYNSGTSSSSEFPEEPFGPEKGLESVSSWKNLADLKPDQFRTANAQKWLVLAKNLSEIGGRSSYRVGDDRFELIMKYNLESFKKFDGVAECLFNNILNGTANEEDVAFDKVTILECLDKWILAYVNRLAELGQDTNQIDEDLALIIRNLIIAGIYNDKNEVLNRFNSNKFNGPLRAFLKIILAEATSMTLPGGEIALTRTEKIERSFPSLNILLADLSKSTEQLLAVKNYNNLLIIEDFERKLMEYNDRLIRVESQYEADEEAQNQLASIKQKIFSLKELLRVAREKTEENLALEKANSYLHFDSSIGETQETPRPYNFPILKGNIGRIIVLFPGWVSVGNAPANFIELPNATDFHAELSFEGNKWLIAEKNTKGSREPVRINGEILMPTWEGLASDIKTRQSRAPAFSLKDGDTVRFGKHIFTYEENHRFTEAAIKPYVDKFVGEYLELTILHKNTTDQDALTKAKGGMDYLLRNGLITRKEYLAKQPDYLIRAALQNSKNIDPALVRDEHEDKKMGEKERISVRPSELASFVKKCTARKIKLSAEEIINLPLLSELFAEKATDDLDKAIVSDIASTGTAKIGEPDSASFNVMMKVEKSQASDLGPLIILALSVKDGDYERAMTEFVYVKMEQILAAFSRNTSVEETNTVIKAMIALGFERFIVKFINKFVSQEFMDRQNDSEAEEVSIPGQIKALRQLLMNYPDPQYWEVLNRRIGLEMIAF